MPRRWPATPLRVSVAVVLAVALVAVPALMVGASPAVASDGSLATAAPPSTATPDGPVRPNSCFPVDGAAFVVGSEGAQLRFTLHLSLLQAVVTAEDASETAAGAFGIEAAATTGGSQVVSLRTGVLFTGIDSATRFLSNPFDAFALAFDYRLRIPAFEGTTAESEYAASEVPVEGPVTEAACSA